MILAGILLIASASQPAQAVSAQIQKNAPVEVTVWVNPTKVSPGEGATAWALVSDNTDDVATATLSRFDIPGFRQVGPCWVNMAPGCNDGGAALASVVVPAHGSVRLHAGLDAQSREISAVPSVSIVWQSKGAARSLVARGDLVTIDSHPAGKTEFFAKVITDLALPVTVFIFGWLLKSQQQRKREEARQQRERDIAERERVRELEARQREQIRTEQSAARRKRAELLATWNQMLIRSHDNAEKHYLPFASAIAALLGADHGLRLARRNGRRTRTSPIDQTLLEDAMFRLLIVLCAMVELRNSIGGFYFKDRRGERLAAFAWGMFVDYGLNWNLDRVRRMRATGQLTKTATIADFRALRTQHAAFNADCVVLIAQFDTWQQSRFGYDRMMLEICLETLSFETNRPFELWYGESEPLPQQPLVRAFRRADRMLSWQNGLLVSGAPLEQEGAQVDRAKDFAELSRRMTVYLERDAG